MAEATAEESSAGLHAHYLKILMQQFPDESRNRINDVLFDTTSGSPEERISRHLQNIAQTLAKTYDASTDRGKQAAKHFIEMAQYVYDHYHSAVRGFLLGAPRLYAELTLPLVHEYVIDIAGEFLKERQEGSLARAVPGAATLLPAEGHELGLFYQVTNDFGQKALEKLKRQIPDQYMGVEDRLHNCEKVAGERDGKLSEANANLARCDHMQKVAQQRAEVFAREKRQLEEEIDREKGLAQRLRSELELTKNKEKIEWRRNVRHVMTGAAVAAGAIAFISATGYFVRSCHSEVPQTAEVQRTEEERERDRRTILACNNDVKACRAEAQKMGSNLSQCQEKLQACIASSPEAFDNALRQALIAPDALARQQAVKKVLDEYDGKVPFYYVDSAESDDQALRGVLRRFNSGMLPDLEKEVIDSLCGGQGIPPSSYCKPRVTGKNGENARKFGGFKIP